MGPFYGTKKAAGGAATTGRTTLKWRSYLLSTSLAAKIPSATGRASDGKATAEPAGPLPGWRTNF
jgi:hypothetical protein